MTTAEYSRTQRSNFDYNSIVSGYYDTVFRGSSGVQSKWHHLKFARIRAEMKSYNAHLDFGCGPGTFISTLTSSSLSIGVDIAPDQIAYAQSTYGTSNHQFMCIESGLLPFDKNSFDIVTIIELIEHLSNEENINLMREIFRVLQPGGLILVSTPNYASFWPIVEWIVNRFGSVSYVHQHITRFNRFRLDVLLKQIGFVNISVDAYQLVSPFFAALNWRLSDVVNRFEPRYVVSRFGLLLLSRGFKSE